ncbi:hypothetical protein [Spirillospora sp. NPDC048819]|uniref:hypothetical protein n=1 Tax=Spirillospora sp. NPDC048819 TaxID=3155268 RepID=UPI0033D9B319
MERETLAALLVGDQDAYSACREALLTGAEPSASSGLVPVSDLIATYAAREAITRENGIPTLGFAVALRSLRTCELEEVLLWWVTQLEPAYLFLLFLSADEARVVACIGVSQDPKFR